MRHRIANVSNVPGLGVQVVYIHDDTGFVERRFHDRDSPLWEFMLLQGEKIKRAAGIEMSLELISVDVKRGSSQFSFTAQKITSKKA